MNEGSPDGGGEEVVAEEVASELIEPKIAPPEIEYTMDTHSGESHKSLDPRCFTWPSIEVELQAICNHGKVEGDSDALICIAHRSDIRGKDIIPNLIRQMEAVRAQILRRKPGSGKELDIREKISDANAIDDPWEIKFVLETGELGDSEDIFKQYRHVRSGRVMVAKLTPDGKLFLPKIPEEWGQLFVEPGA